MQTLDEPSTVTQARDGKWQVITEHGAVLASFETNAEAWKWLDTHG